MVRHNLLMRFLDIYQGYTMFLLVVIIGGAGAQPAKRNPCHRHPA
jgi:hypothetical protein